MKIGDRILLDLMLAGAGVALAIGGIIALIVWLIF